MAFLRKIHSLTITPASISGSALGVSYIWQRTRLPLRGAFLRRILPLENSLAIHQWGRWYSIGGAVTPRRTQKERRRGYTGGDESLGPLRPSSQKVPPVPVDAQTCQHWLDRGGARWSLAVAAMVEDHGCTTTVRRSSLFRRRFATPIFLETAFLLFESPPIA